MAVCLNQPCMLYVFCKSSQSSNIARLVCSSLVERALAKRIKRFANRSVIGQNGSSDRRKSAIRFEEDDTGRSTIEDHTDEERPPFDINLAVVLAGFAFEAYNTPSDNKGTHEIDPYGCKTVFLSEQFLRESYDGQLTIELKRGSNFPGLDLWGTSDPYITFRVGESVVRSNTVWRKTEPVWNESFTINVKNAAAQYLQVAAWDANLLTSDRRLGNAGVNLDALSDGERHEVKVELGGMGGGGRIELEVQYQTFSDIDAQSTGWKIPFFSEYFQTKGLGDFMKGTFAFEGLTAQDFLNSTLGLLQQKPETKEAILSSPSKALKEESSDANKQSILVDAKNMGVNVDGNLVKGNENDYESLPLRKDGFGNLREGIGKKFGVPMDKIGIPFLNHLSWDGIDVLKRFGLESRNKAEMTYVKNGLAIAPIEGGFEPDKKDNPNVEDSVSGSLKPQAMDIEKALKDLWRQTEDILQSWSVIAASFAGQKASEQNHSGSTKASVEENSPLQTEELMPVVAGQLVPQSAEEMEELRKMFGKAESAMEAWAVLAKSLGQASFIKSAFQKICFLDNEKTDTQVAVWRDVQHQRLVIAFRGTEQVKWKDLRTDLMLLPVGFNPERIGGDFKEEAMVHGGFLNAYDSVHNRLMSIIKTTVQSSDNGVDSGTWHVYLTGHSLGGALATLLALDLTTTSLYRNGQIKLTMYNFGSPRVGNKIFAELYNARVKDSWRVVNHRDIIPTVPRLMGYCHVAQPVYLTAGDMSEATVNLELVEDGYRGDIIGEATPDFLLEEFMKGEKRLIDRLFQTEIAMLRALRDGSALMQHMEDFYYISLLESSSPKAFNIKTSGDKTL